MLGNLTLSLLVSRIAAHDVHDAAAPDNLALVADSLDAGSYFHRDTRSTELAQRSQTARQMVVNV
jgi:hypothetical protein